VRQELGATFATELAEEQCFWLFRSAEAVCKCYF
jgi:hypothetical protein